MTVAIVDYGSGNLRSAAKAFERAAREVLAPDARAVDEQRRFQRETGFELGARGLLDERLSAMQMALIAEGLGRVDSSAREAAHRITGR